MHNIFLSIEHLQKRGDVRHKINNCFRFFFFLWDLTPWIGKINIDLKNQVISFRSVSCECAQKDRQNALYSFYFSLVLWITRWKITSLENLLFVPGCILWGYLEQQLDISSYPNLIELIQLIGGGSCSVEGISYSRTNLET